jgi:uncharacterized damage-inducible protein DinB
MDPEAALFLIRYHIRSNERILETTAKLSDEEFRRSASLDYESAYETLLHILIVDWSWREFCISMDDDDDSYPEGWPLQELESIASFWTDEHARLLTYVGSLDERALAQPLTWKSDRGLESHPRWAVLVHIVNHGTQHRSELARFLTECGHSPGDMDLL